MAEQRSQRRLSPYELVVVSPEKIEAKQKFNNDEFLIANELDHDGALSYKVVDPSGAIQRGVISQKALKKQFGNKGYKKFQEVLGYQDTLQLSDRFFRGLLRIAAKEKHVSPDRFPPPLALITAMERKEYWGKGENEKESPEEKTERICQIIEVKRDKNSEKDKELREKFINACQNSRTPLYYAIKGEEGNLEIVQTLLKNGARVNYPYNSNVQSVLELVRASKLKAAEGDIAGRA